MTSGIPRCKYAKLSNNRPFEIDLRVKLSPSKPTKMPDSWIIESAGMISVEAIADYGGKPFRRLVKRQTTIRAMGRNESAVRRGLLKSAGQFIETFFEKNFAASS